MMVVVRMVSTIAMSVVMMVGNGGNGNDGYDEDSLVVVAMVVLMCVYIWLLKKCL